MFCKAIPCELLRAFDKNLGREFLNLTPEEVWSFLEFFYEHTKPWEKLEPSFELHSLESHTDLLLHTPTSLDPHDPSLERGVGVVEPLYKQTQHREEISLKVDSSSHETSTHIDSTLEDSLFESTACPYVRPLTEAEITESKAFLSLAKENPNSKTLNFEWSDCSDNGWDSEENESFDSSPPDSNIHEPLFVKSLEDMPTNTTTELESHPTLTTQVTLDSHDTAISSGEHTVEPIILVSSCSTTPLNETTNGWVSTSIPQDSHESEFPLSLFKSLTDRPESESGAQLFSFALTPTENPTDGTEYVLTKNDHTCREVVEAKKVVCIDFLGIEGMLETQQPYSMFTYANNFGSYLGFKDPYKAIHPPVFSLLGAHSFLVPLRLEEHIIELVDLRPLLDIAPSKSLTTRIVNDYNETNHHWGEVVEKGKNYIDFLGVERLIEHTMSTLVLTRWPHLGFDEPHLAFHSLVCFTSEVHPPLVLCGVEENILFLKPFLDAWDIKGVG